MLSFDGFTGLPAKWVRSLRVSKFSQAVIFFLILSAGVWLNAALAQSVRPSPVDDVEGILEILHEDSDHGSRYHYFLNTGAGRLILNFAKQPPTHLLSGARVRVRGEPTNSVLALQSGADSVQTVAAAVPNTLGEQRTLIILVNFRNDNSQPYTTAFTTDIVFGTTSNFFLENSYQQTYLSGLVRGWYQIDMDSPVDSATCDYGRIASLADAAAANAGVVLSNYSHKVYAFPQSGCSWWGLSSVGGNPSQSWINGRLELGVAAHELGHGLGLWHSHSLDCGSNAVVGAGCSINEYGDIVDMMGASQAAHYNSFQKERLGWLNAGSSPPITTVNMAGTYTLAAYENVTSAPKALKILRSTDPITSAKTWFYVEARKAVGFDSFLSNEPSQNVTAGVLIRTGTEGNGDSSFLLDMTPATPVYYWWYDPALAVGQSFTDADAGVTITANSVNSTGASVTVSFAASVAVATDQPSYNRTQTVSISATVSAGGVRMANTPVGFAITKSNGAVVTASMTTGSNGTAVYKLRLTKKDPVGTYAATATALSAQATTYFTVR
jgi:hypothetical protein